jgi:ABC-type antimicrobial peptide transport system permease subunit
MLGAIGMLKVITAASGGQMMPMALSTDALGWSALIALVLGLVTGAAPALAAYRLKITDAFSRR